MEEGSREKEGDKLTKKRPMFLSDVFKCGVCGRSSNNHEYFTQTHFGPPIRYPIIAGREHTIQKMGKLRWAELMRRLHDHGRFECAHYGGFCPENNNCPALSVKRDGGDFGWGECAHIALEPVVRKEMVAEEGG